jgi:EmrB/QacA subfamily drug resistance transporter
MTTSAHPLTHRERNYIIGSALLALFLGALDALIMSAAMPTIVAELGGLHLYAWVYSAYFLSRAVSLPIFGKLADIYNTRNLFLISIALFLVSSIAAGTAQSMTFLIFCRVIQGIGAGGNFALVYIVLSDVASPDKRAKTLSLASSVWGISSVIGPTLGGFIVSYLSWRWIFFINIPMGIFCLAGIGLFLKESRQKRTSRTSLDLAGLGLFSGFILGLLIIFITGGRELAWISAEMTLLTMLTGILGLLFYVIEKKAENPLIDIRFFRNPNFVFGNSAVFFSSLTIFSFFAYAPLYIQGSLALSPMQVGLAMVSLSLGWSFGSLFIGRILHRSGSKRGAVSGGIILLVGSLLTLRFDVQTTMFECFLVFLIVGLGMGFVTLSTLILVQNSAEAEDLGIVTSLHQFGRSLGGTIGVGICGGLVTNRLFDSLEKTVQVLPLDVIKQLNESIENILRPEFQSLLAPTAMEGVRVSVFSGVYAVFIIAVASSFLCLLCCLSISEKKVKK